MKTSTALLIADKYLDKSFSIEDFRGFGNLGGLMPENLWHSTYSSVRG